MSVIKDAKSTHWVYSLKKEFIPYAQLARLDRPIGSYLLLFPCLFSLFLAIASPIGKQSSIMQAIGYALLFFIGSIVMRGAGCTVNDLADIEIDKQVDRTKLRPLACGSVSKRNAFLFLLLQCLIGLAVLVQFNFKVIITAFAFSIIAVIYPFTKRYIYFPQLFLGLSFGSGAILGWLAIKDSWHISILYLYIAQMCWTMGYDTIYAYQDVEDDVKVGIGSTAIYMGANPYPLLIALYGVFVVFMALAIYYAKLSAIAYLFLAIAAIHLIWQIYTLDIKDTQRCLALFKANGFVGIIISLGLLISYLV